MLFMMDLLGIAGDNSFNTVQPCNGCNNLFDARKLLNAAVAIASQKNGRVQPNR